MATAKDARPAGVLAWILEDEGRTRRARSFLYVMAPVAVIVVVTLAVVMLLSPLAGAVTTGLLGVPAAVAATRRRRPTRLPG